jgi:hypothetical protein
MAMLTVNDRESLARAGARSLRDGGRVLVSGTHASSLRPHVRTAITEAGKRARVSTIGPHMGALAALPFKDQLFDLVVCTRESGNAIAQARELVRVTLPGGTVVVQTGHVPRRKLEMELERLGCDIWPRRGAVIARIPGPRTGAMRIKVKELRGWTPERVQRLLRDLPVARGYEVVVKPLRWRKRPHVQAFCEFDERRITIQVPTPFLPFWEDVPYRAKRLHAKGLKFKWYMRRLRFTRPHELIRYLYLHEYYHWYLRETLGRKSGAETACDRFALQRLGAIRTR